MAERKATLILELKDQASKGVKSLVDVYAGLKLGVEVVNQTLGRLKDFLLDSLDAFGESERSVKALENALRNQGFYSKEYSRSLQDQATALQNVSTFSDEAILDTQTLLTTFGLAGAQLSKTTQAAMDLSVGLGVDLRTATLILGKAWAGETGTLARYGIKIDETLTGAKAFEAVLAQVSGRFGGAASVAADTYAGKVQNLAERWDNLKESIGSLMVGEAVKVVEWAKIMVGLTDNLIKKIGGLGEAFDNLTLEKMGDKAAGVGVGFISLMNKVGLVKDETRLALQAMLDLKRAADNVSHDQVKGTPSSKMPAADSETQALAKKLQDQSDLEEFSLAERARKKIESLSMTQQQLDDMEVEDMARGLQAQGMHEEAKSLLALQAQKNQANQARQMHVALSASLTHISSLANAKTKELALIGKSAAIANATIQTFVAANAARAALSPIPIVGPALGIAAAAAAIAAGVANVSAIMGVQLAEGGMVTARSGGVHATMAEAGHDEVAIPLDDDRTKERLRDTFGGSAGGGNTYEFHIGTLIADDMGLSEFARRIDEKLFALDRRSGRVSG